MLVRTSASLSLIGCLAILAHIALHRQAASACPHRIVVWWTCAELVFVPAALMGRAYIDSPTGCTLQSVLVHFGLLSSVTWGAMLATNVLLSVVLHYTQAQIEALERVYHLVAWLVPAILNILPLLLPRPKLGSGLFGDAELWCSIRPEYSALRMYFFYGPIMALFLYCLVIYVLVGVRLWRTTGKCVCSELRLSLAHAGQ
ncbi:hypothetical protein RI367_005377 [Sorochytrium milnesiophthora]